MCTDDKQVLAKPVSPLGSVGAVGIGACVLSSKATRRIASLEGYRRLVIESHFSRYDAKWARPELKAATCEFLRLLGARRVLRLSGVRGKV